ncbi:MAG: PucR family transcriptional regulator ligand-binding domain-containing protein [Firmicutes bacterium]|jgi:purine catabolism regulator|nr:PucR family transcriptional regulator ligand-binding domain-containing protein [Bacillota bacterium]
MIPLGELLKVDPLTRGTVLTGSGRLSNMVSDVVILAGPRVDGWLKVGQLVITSGYPIEKEELKGSRFVRELHAAGAAGLLYVPRWLGDKHLSEILLAAKELDFPVVRIPSDIEFSEITRAVWSRLNYINGDFGILDVGSEIAVETYGALDRLAGVLSDMTGSDITIRDRDGAVITRRTAGSGPVGPGAGARESTAEIALPLVLAGGTVGTVSISRGHGSGLLDRTSLEVVAHAVAEHVKLLGAVRRMRSLHRRLCLWKLMFSPGSLAFPQELEKAGIGVADLVACLAVRGTDQVVGIEGTRTMTVEAFAPRCNEVILAFLWSGDTPLPVAAKSMEEITERIARAPECDGGRPIRIGSSSVHRGVIHLQVALYEARSAISPPAAVSDDVRRPVVSNDLIGQVEPKLALLYEYDQTHGTELVKTLREFYSSNCCMAETARRMYVHRRTLEYRLRRIQQICDLDIRSPRTRIKLEVCLALR